MTWAGHAPSGYFWTINTDGQILRTDWETAKGDASGLIDNLIVVGIQGRPVSSLAPASGFVLSWDGSAWVPSSPSGESTVHNLLSATHPDTIPASPVLGDIIAGSGTPASWVRFPVGQPNQQLRVSESGFLEWGFDPIEIITSGVSINLDSNTHRIVINKASGSPMSVNLPSSPYFGQEILVKDGKGDANVNHISVLPPSGLTVDGFLRFVITQRYQSVHFMYNGTEWNVI